MSGSDVTLIVLVCVAVLVVAAWASAGRVDRLYRRADVTKAALETQLLRRSTVALELASSHLLNPAASLVLSSCALAAQEAGDIAADTGAAQWRADAAAESELSVALREALGEREDLDDLRKQADGEPLLSALASAWYRAMLARRFFNDAVADAERLSHNPVIRTFRLDGRRVRPQAFDIDDEMPPGLEAMVSGVD